jgi:DNA polymerase-3 subunit epsilon
MRLGGWLNRLFPSPQWDEEVYWALDLETSGLQVQTDEILSVGMVPLRGGVIRYGERFASLIRPMGEDVSTEGLPAHHLIPAEYRDAPPLGEIIGEIDRRVREGVLLVHHAPLDIGFLKQAYRRLGRPRPRFRVLDTIDLLLALHFARHKFTPHPPKPRTGLADARRDLGLPEHTEHDALGDALATAELFLHLRQRLNSSRLREFPLRRL